MGVNKKINDAQFLEACRAWNWHTQSIAEALGYTARAVQYRMNSLAENPDIAVECLNGKRQNLKLQDKNRVLNKIVRETNRPINAIEDLITSLKEELQHYKTPALPKFKNKTGDAIGVVQLSDVHFNELVQDVGNNKYDFTVAGKRLKMHVDAAKRIFKAQGITKVLLAMTGDLLNSDRRLDELLTNVTNRSKATLLSVFMLEQVIMDLAQDFTVSVASVTGNESRVGKDRGWIN
jgi:hypothetical protein